MSRVFSTYQAPLRNLEVLHLKYTALQEQIHAQCKQWDRSFANNQQCGKASASSVGKHRPAAADINISGKLALTQTGPGYSIAYLTPYARALLGITTKQQLLRGPWSCAPNNAGMPWRLVDVCDILTGNGLQNNKRPNASHRAHRIWTAHLVAFAIIHKALLCLPDS